MGVIVSPERETESFETIRDVDRRAEAPLEEEREQEQRHNITPI